MAKLNNQPPSSCSGLTRVSPIAIKKQDTRVKPEYDDTVINLSYLAIIFIGLLKPIEENQVGKESVTMIFGDKMDFFIQLDILINNGYLLGPLNFWIDGKAYPGKGAVITVSTEIPMLEEGLEKALNHKFKESNLPIEEIDFDYEELAEENIIFWHLMELGDYGLDFRCEIVKDTLRLFYSLNGSPFQVKEVPLEYYKKIIDELGGFLDEIDPPTTSTEA